MVATNLASFINETDSNNDKIGTWAVAADGVSMAKCLACESQGLCKPFTFDKGKSSLVQHSKTKRHIDSMRKFNQHSRQLAISSSIYEK